MQIGIQQWKIKGPLVRCLLGFFLLLFCFDEDAVKMRVLCMSIDSYSSSTSTSTAGCVYTVPRLYVAFNEQRCLHVSGAKYFGHRRRPSTNDVKSNGATKSCVWWKQAKDTNTPSVCRWTDCVGHVSHHRFWRLLLWGNLSGGRRRWAA